LVGGVLGKTNSENKKERELDGIGVKNIGTGSEFTPEVICGKGGGAKGREELGLFLKDFEAQPTPGGWRVKGGLKGRYGCT